MSKWVSVKNDMLEPPAPKWPSCPFCGSHLSKCKRRGMHFSVRCVCCGARGPKANSAPHAIQLWRFLRWGHDDHA